MTTIFNLAIELFEGTTLGFDLLFHSTTLASLNVYMRYFTREGKFSRYSCSRQVMPIDGVIVTLYLKVR